ncbi:MAG: tetratricopeptide repeat protein [bacterium]|nr:tetratricopeptide repeat protein [bacterium]
MDKTTAYQILEIPKEATDDEIKHAYIQLVKKHPPEIEPDKFIQIRKAYENLKDPVKRAREDLFTFNFVHDQFHFDDTVKQPLPINRINDDITALSMQLESFADDPETKHQLILAYSRRAFGLVHKKLWAEAIRDWEHILSLDTTNEDIQHNLFYGYSTLGYYYALHERFQEAINFWQKANVLKPNIKPLYHNLAIAYDKIGDKEHAENYWRETLKRWELNLRKESTDEYLKTCIVELHKYFGGKLLSGSGDKKAGIEEAISEYREVLKIAPDNFHAQLQITTAYMQEGKWTEAIKELSSMLRIHKDNLEVLNMLGWAYLNSGKVDESFAVWNRGLAIDSKNQIAKDNIIRGHLTVGKKLRERGLFNSALVHFKSVLKYLPSKPEVHLEIGNTYAMKGDYRSAVACWQTVLQLDPKNKIAKKAIAETRFR